MPAAAQTTMSRPLTPAELAVVIKMYREANQWSQEQLADVAGLSTRTVQRVESGHPSDLDTRRAMARAFGLEDIDALNKPYVIPTPDEIKAQREQFEREHITLDAHPLATGRQLAGLAETNGLDLSTPGFDMERAADEEFAALVDYVRDYRDCASLFSEVQKFEVYDDLQRHIDALKAMGVSLRYAVRPIKLQISADPAAKPWEASALYVVTYPAGKEPERFATPRKFKIG